MASQMKLFIVIALMAALVCVNAQDYDDEGSSQGEGGDGGFSGGSSSDDDYAAPRERGVIGAEGSDAQPGYHQVEDAGSDNYDADDVAAAASHTRPSISRPNIIRIIKQSRK